MSDPSMFPRESESSSGYGIFVGATLDWLRSSDTSMAAMVFKTHEHATAYLTSQQQVHGQVLPFEWR